ncbi:MAG: hypothetical protein LBK47_08395 [Prevotellaceae bacterium]|jgi:hypothetical protein|nr:hypothetical protein [Prevotellaceae bacterium]
MKKCLPLLFLLFTTLAMAQNSSFDGLKNHLDGISGLRPGYFTVFVGLDINFADGRLQSYLQQYKNLAIDDASVVFTKEKISMRYIPRVNSGRDRYIVVTSYLENSKTAPYYYKTEDGTSNIIKRVEITGSCDLIIDFFVSYWNRKIEIGGYQKREIASYQCLGDYVVLSGTDKPNVCKIGITKGNIDFNYNTTFNLAR